MSTRTYRWETCLAILAFVVACSQPAGAIAVNQADKGMSSEEVQSKKIRREGKALDVLQTEDHAAPTIHHRTPLSAQRGMDMVLSASVSDPSGIALVRVYYRSAGHAEYMFREMTHKAEDIYETVIPGYIMIGDDVQYYFAAWDQLGNGPGFFGTDQDPRRIIFPGRKEGTSPTLMFVFLIGAIFMVAMVPRWMNREASVC